MIRVALVDDEAVVRQTVTLLLQETGTFELTGCYTNAHEALAGLRQSPPVSPSSISACPMAQALRLSKPCDPNCPAQNF